MENKITLIENFVRNYMRTNRIPGLSLGIVQKNQPNYLKGFGLRDLENNLLMTSKTLVNIASVTKSFIAFGLMKLIERKLINLDDSVSHYLKFPPFSDHPELDRTGSRCPGLSGPCC